MLDTANFLVRSSGRKENCYYVDYSGYYKAADIGRQLQLKPEKIKEIYEDNGGLHDKDLDVYYFNNIFSAKKSITDMLACSIAVDKGRSILLTEDEIEYIRKALINDGMGNIGIDANLKNAIFKKLNGQ